MTDQGPYANRETLAGPGSSRLLPELYVHKAHRTSVSAYLFGAGVAWDTESERAQAVRTATPASAAKRPTLCLFLGTSERAEIRHLGRVSTIDQGDMVFIESDAGCSIEVANSHHHTIWQLPKDILGERARLMQNRAGLRLSGEDPRNAAVHSALLALIRGAPHFAREDHIEAHAAAVHLLDLAIGNGAPPALHDERLYERAMRVMHQNLQSPRLHVESIARSLRVSRRQLELAFASRGRTVARSIWDARLSAAAAMLAADAAGDRSLLEIAQRCGFMSAAHFSRRFRMRFGVPPSEYRLTHAPERG